MGATEVAQNPLRKIASNLRNKRMASFMNVIEHTRGFLNFLNFLNFFEFFLLLVPIVKYTDIKTGIDCDISFDMTGGILMGKARIFFHFYCARFDIVVQLFCRVFSLFFSDMVAQKKVFAVLLEEPEFVHARSLIVLIKYWLRCRGHHEPFNGGLGSYSVLILVIAHLQHNCAKSLSELFVSFFQFYGTQFNWITTGISLKNGGSFFSKKIMGGNFECAESWKPALQDCCDESNNVASSSFNFPKIRDAFRETFDILTSGKPTPFGVLPLIFPRPYLERIN